MVAWTAWLLTAAGVCLVADIGWPARVIIWMALACTRWPFRRLVGLCGARSVISAGEDGRGIFIIVAGAPGRRLRATPVDLRRFGNLLWVLNFSTSQGRYSRLICPASQEPRALRRLVRRFGQLPAGAAPGQFGPRQGRS